MTALYVPDDYDASYAARIVACATAVNTPPHGTYLGRRPEHTVEVVGPIDDFSRTGFDVTDVPWLVYEPTTNSCAAIDWSFSDPDVGSSYIKRHAFKKMLRAFINSSKDDMRRIVTTIAPYAPDANPSDIGSVGLYVKQARSGRTTFVHRITGDCIPRFTCTIHQVLDVYERSYV